MTRPAHSLALLAIAILALPCLRALPGAGAGVAALVETPAALLERVTDEEKQRTILEMVLEHCEPMPPELVIAIIRQEAGQGAFHAEPWKHNPFYDPRDGPWAQPTNGDGIMQVTRASGWHQVSGPYTNDRRGYENAIRDGCSYLRELYETYGTLVQAALHYNSGPHTLYIYLGKMWGDRDYLSKLADHLRSFVPSYYGIYNRALAGLLDRAQGVLNKYLYYMGLEERQSLEYYAPYQERLDAELHELEKRLLYTETPTTPSPTPTPTESPAVETETTQPTETPEAPTGTTPTESPSAVTSPVSAAGGLAPAVAAAVAAAAVVISFALAAKRRR